MPHTIERENIRKERSNYPSYAGKGDWIKHRYIIKKASRQTSDFYKTKEDFFPAIKKNKFVFEVKEFKVQLPNCFNLIAIEIKDSKNLMELEEDWDGDGGTQVSFDTWKKAASFIVDYALWLYDNHQNFVMESPQINPGPGTSIDLLWRNEKYRLLVNIPETSENPIEYYGDNNQGENSIKGKLKSDSIQEFFALWLKNMKK